MMSDATDCRRVWCLPASLTLVISLLLLAGPVQTNRVTLRDVCTNAQVPIVSVEEFKRIFEEFKSDYQFEICAKRYRLAFTMLEPIILDKQQAVCGDEEFALIERFHSRFISDEQIEEEGHISNDKIRLEQAETVGNQLGSEERARCPISLRQLFKAYTLQASGLCKQKLVDNLNRAMQSMNDHDFELFEALKFRPRAESKVALLGRADEMAKDSNNFQFDLSFRALAHMPELGDKLGEGHAKFQQDKIRTDFQQDNFELDKFMRTCRKRFRPVYSKLILPIVRLAKLGYDYVGHHLDRVRDELKSEDINTWLMVTLICESHNNFELADEKDDDKGQEMGELNFEPVRNRPFEGELWIKDAQQLAYEFRVADLMQQKGLKKFLADSQVAGRKLASTLDPKQFAWYRDNEGTIKLMTNTARIFAQFWSKVAAKG